ncbi:unnamed protein product, partial [Iphiclides podalirius]
MTRARATESYVGVRAPVRDETGSVHIARGKFQSGHLTGHAGSIAGVRSPRRRFPLRPHPTEADTPKALQLHSVHAGTRPKSTKDKRGQPPGRSPFQI